ncbi:HMG domain-containing protein 3 isoform X1 [Carcharodon carcharias]|uniref:HMG domain-containing protein 3 isoform X1 n=1 Tax=Carcharodon carcharias TaxID=13397 RepID=UPI001B7E20DD|nr:HMG domain-containing protein 3 isoform X1 [Carcharodon carcharias]
MDAPYDGAEITLVTEEIEGCYSCTKNFPPKKKKKWKEQSEDGGKKGKKPRPAYLLYYYDTHLKVQQDFPNLPRSEINKKISESWRRLSVAEKGIYLEKAKLEKEGIDPSDNLTSASTGVPPADIPGFRKILPRSSYIIIPTSNLSGDGNGQQLAQSPTQRGGEGNATWQTLTHDTIQSLFTVSSTLTDSGHIDSTEESIAIDGITDEAFIHTETMQEIVTSEMLSQFSNSGDDKVAGELATNETSLELTHPYDSPCVVIEGTLIGTGSDASESVASCTNQQTMEPNSVIAVLSNQSKPTGSLTSPHKALGQAVGIDNKQDLGENVPASTTQFLMLPLTSKQSTAPAKKSIFAQKTTYTRRGRGSCPNPNCLFTYVTRHKPPQCPNCGKWLGGKWIPKGKELQVLNVRVECNQEKESKVYCKETADLSFGTKDTAQSSLESSQAVNQLLSVASEDQREEEQQPMQTNWQQTIHVGPNEPTTAPTVQTEERVLPVQLCNAALTGEHTVEVQSEGAIKEPEVLNHQTSEATSSTISGSHGVNCTKPGSSISRQGLQVRQRNRARGRTKSGLMTGAARSRPRVILPAAPSNAAPQSGVTYIRVVTMPINQADAIDSSASSTNNKATARGSSAKSLMSSPPPSGLKPSTLKQLGHSVLHPNYEDGEEQTGLNVATENGSPQTSAAPVKSVCLTLPKTNKASAFDLGLATCRGKGRCKNPKCSYVYMNRYKPGICPKCGYDFTRDKQDIKPSKPVINSALSLGLLNPEEGLTQASKDLQRQTTLLLLRRTVQIPENEAELHEIFSLIQEMNSSRLILSTVNETITLEQNSWPNYFESSATICGLCDSQLFKGGHNSVAGPEECWLLTESQFQVVIVQAKICLNPHCLALHNFMDISSGLFNIGNKLLVSLDLLFKIRNHIKLGEDPRDVTTPILNSVQKFTEKILSDEQLNQLQELLWNGYWAFESLTIRDYNDMICGICGVAPKLEVAQRSPENILALKNVEFTWPDFPTSDEVNVEDFWSTMENEAIEQAVFPSSIPITKFDASIIAPFIPPLLRASVVVNSEKDKNPQPQPVAGNPRMLVRLLHDEVFKPEELNSYSEAELKNLLVSCDIPFHPSDSKEHLSSSLFALYSYVLDGSTSQIQPPCDVTGGKVYKLCLHQVVCGSKYLVRKESARDHVDLLVSSRYWPPVYVVDMAPHVALNADVRYPEIAGQIWGHKQGCFSDPLEPPKHVSCPELLDQHYTMDVAVTESNIQHPITKSNARRIVYHDADQSAENNTTARHHSASLCSELEPYSNLLKAIPDSKVHDVRQKSITFENATYYFLYNRLVDFLSSRDIVNQQINEVLQSCQPGEVVIRDSLYRLGIAHLNTESETEELA